MKLEFVPLSPDRSQMEKYLKYPFCFVVYKAWEAYFPKVGFEIPWIGYFALLHDEVVGTGGFKGPPTEGKVEIAYGTVPGQEGLGYASQICAKLTSIAFNEKPGIRITARTLMEESASTSILKKNGYLFVGEVHDPEDGMVWEWEYKQA